MDEENLVTLIDEETGEEQDFLLDDKFKLNGKVYVSLICIPDDVTDIDELPEEVEIVIMEAVEDGDETVLKTLEEDEENIVYDYYDKICSLADAADEEE